MTGSPVLQGCSFWCRGAGTRGPVAKPTTKILLESKARGSSLTPAGLPAASPPATAPVCTAAPGRQPCGSLAL